MSKTERVEARVLPSRKQRYELAAEKLRLDELSDFVRRACDDLADHVLATYPEKPAAGGKRAVTPDPRKKR